MTQTLEQTETKPGVYRNMSFADYYNIEAVNWHSLEPYRVSAKLARHKQLHRPDASEAQKNGEAFHAAVLEPERLSVDYAAMPQFDGHPNSTAHRAAKAAWLEEHKTNVTLTREEYQETWTMGQAVAAHPVASQIISGRGRNELVIVWHDKETGILCKGRIDRLCYVPALAIFPGSSSFKPSDQVLCLVDVKTTRKVQPGPRDFEGEIARYGYHAQLAWYNDGLQIIQPAPVIPIIVAVENAPPFDVVVYRFDDESIEHGRKLYSRLLQRHIQCRKDEDWPGACPSIISVALPSWGEEQEGMN